MKHQFVLATSVISVEKIETDKHERNSALVVVQLQHPTEEEMVDYYGEVCFYFSHITPAGNTHMLALVRWTDTEMGRPKRSTKSGLPYYKTNVNRASSGGRWYDVISADSIRRPVGFIRRTRVNYILDKMVTVDNLV